MHTHARAQIQIMFIELYENVSDIGSAQHASVNPEIGSFPPFIILVRSLAAYRIIGTKPALPD
jgi:hypothetical protein